VARDVSPDEFPELAASSFPALGRATAGAGLLGPPGLRPTDTFVGLAEPSAPKPKQSWEIALFPSSNASADQKTKPAFGGGYQSSDDDDDDDDNGVGDVASPVYRLSALPPPGSSAEALSPPPVRGLRNLGNSCYLNCVLQSLVATHGVREHFLLTRKPEGGSGGGLGPEPEGELTVALRRLVHDLHERGGAAHPIAPTELLQAVSNRHARYGKRAQQDAHEVLRQLLEGVRAEEITRLKALAAPQKRAGSGGGNGTVEPDPRTLIDATFAGELRQSVACLTCGAISCGSEPFLDLSLPIPTLRAAGRTPAQQKALREEEARREAAGEPPPVAAAVAAADAAEAAEAAEPASAEADGSEAACPPCVPTTTEAVLAKLPTELTTPQLTMRLSACLQAFGAPESLEGDNAYQCDACNARRRAEAEAEGVEPPPPAGQPGVRWTQVARTPAALTLHLKRFRWMGRKVQKLDAHVPFPPSLDLAPYACLAGAPVKHVSQLPRAAAAAVSQSALRLYAVVEHQGSFEGGHYIAFVKLGGEWFRMSDNHVTKVEESVVLEAQAFLLFYAVAPSTS